MAELLLDDVDGDAFGDELGGVGVAQAARVDALVDASLGGSAFAHLPDLVGGQRGSLLAYEAKTP